MTAEEIFDILLKVSELDMDIETAENKIIKHIKKCYNKAVRDIQKEYETNKEFNVTSILKYLK